MRAEGSPGLRPKLPRAPSSWTATYRPIRRSPEPRPNQGTTLLKITNGKSLQPLSGRPPKQIVLLLHGYGSNGDDLIAMAGPWQHLLPDALFLAPNAPQRSGMGRGYRWWALNAYSPAALAAGAAAAAPAVNAFLDRKLDQYELSDSNVALVGFSKGTMMALHVG